MAGVARGSDAASGSSEDWPILFFEKPVQKLSYEEIGDRLAAMGVQGIEATIRKGGHILPEDAAKEIPTMLKALNKAGLDRNIAATDVLDADRKTSEFLKVLKEHGITEYRMGYYRYDKRSSPMDQVDGFRERMLKLADLNEQLGMQGLYQIHSGAAFVGSLVWDVVGMMKGVNPLAMGLGYDLRHTRTDTGTSWKQAAAIAKRHIRSLYIKDAKWDGERTDRRINVALDEGFVSREIFDHTRRDLDPMPLTLHMEWGDHQIYPKEAAPEAWKLIRRDVDVLKAWRG